MESQKLSQGATRQNVAVDVWYETPVGLVKIENTGDQQYGWTVQVVNAKGVPVRGIRTDKTECSLAEGQNLILQLSLYYDEMMAALQNENIPLDKRQAVKQFLAQFDSSI